MLLPPVKAVNSWKITIALTYFLSGLLGAHGHHLQLPKLNIAQDKLVKKGKHPSLLAFSPNSITSCLGSQPSFIQGAGMVQIFLTCQRHFKSWVALYCRRNLLENSAVLEKSSNFILMPGSGHQPSAFTFQTVKHLSHAATHAIFPNLNQCKRRG